MSIVSIRRPGAAPSISQDAAQWVLRQEAGTLSENDEESFAAWLAADPSHVEAYEDAIWALDASARHAGDARIREMREAALAARGERLRRSWLWSLGGGALAASVAAFAILLAPGTSAPPSGAEIASLPAVTDSSHATYRTAIGERLTVTLPDGSVATLDTDSELQVAYDRDARGLLLMRGQAMFEVAHGRNRPFRVRAAGQDIVAVGTTFNVRLRGERVEVALVEGTVSVRPATPVHGGVAREVVMRAGERLEAAPGGLVSVRAADVGQVAAWRNGELVFNDARLADAVAEINRYAIRPVEIEDERIGGHRISGVFRSNDPERFARAMAEILPVETALRPDRTPVLRARRN